MRLARVALICFFWVSAVGAAAQEPRAGETAAARAMDAPSDTVYTMGEVTVTALRAEAPPALIPQRVTVLDRMAIDASGSRTVADLLARRTGLFIRRYGQGLATASLRGSSPSQSMIMIDGLRLSDPQLGQFDLSLLPAYLLESVEVLHGPASALYGSDGVAGVINLRRLRPRANRAALASEVGAFGERTINGTASLVGRRIRGLIAAEAGISAGDFPYVNQALFPAREVRRQNADREKRSLFASVEADRGAHRLQGGFLYAAAAQGLPGPGAASPQGERQWDEHVRFWLDDALSIPGGAVHVRGFAHHGSMRYLNPLLSIDSESRTRSYSLESEARVGIGSSATMTGGAVAGYMSAEHPSLARDAREYQAAAFLSGAGIYGRLRIYPAIRADYYRLHDRVNRLALNPRLGANLQPFSHLPVHLKVNVGRAYRTPTFNDRYWRPGGNPALHPERSWSYEGGIFVAGRTQVEVTLFASETEDQITWLPRAGGIWSPENLSRTRVRGLETSLRSLHEPAGNWTLQGGLFHTWTAAIDVSDPSSPAFGRQLRYVPRHQVKTWLGLRAGAFAVDFNAEYVGRRYVTSDESEAVGAAILLAARTAFTGTVARFRGRLSLDLENALDRPNEIIKNYPMPPRHVRLGLLIQTASEKSDDQVQ